mmetsp:Transcript_18805/g.38429  ORF Transcript_18805/g.38429 Transcript_18805/m.38429 type:complete len:270 (-) Transcript_18805:872-1681(-)
MEKVIRQTFEPASHTTCLRGIRYSTTFAFSLLRLNDNIMISRVDCFNIKLAACDASLGTVPFIERQKSPSLIVDLEKLPNTCATRTNPFIVTKCISLQSFSVKRSIESSLSIGLGLFPLKQVKSSCPIFSLTRIAARRALLTRWPLIANSSQSSFSSEPRSGLVGAILDTITRDPSFLKTSPIFSSAWALWAEAVIHFGNSNSDAKRPVLILDSCRDKLGPMPLGMCFATLRNAVDFTGCEFSGSDDFSCNESFLSVVALSSESLKELS